MVISGKWDGVKKKYIYIYYAYNWGGVIPRCSSWSMLQLCDEIALTKIIF